MVGIFDLKSNSNLVFSKVFFIIISRAKKIDKISYDEMLELSSLG